ncbi:MAG: hypothetical protein Q8N06_02795 [Hydrogenophaga sp.]|nr:hypothetical protein [Hydrogenophaga sp.]
MEDDIIEGGAPDAGTTDSADTTSSTSVADAALAALGMEEGADSAPGESGITETVDGDIVEPLAEVDPLKKPDDKKVEAPKPGEDGLTEEDLQRPENISHKARDRFEKLVTGYKTEKAQREQAEAELTQHRESFKALQDLGFSDEASGRDLVEFAQFRQALVSNPKQALQTLQNMMRQIELQHGVRAPSTSALDAFPDLVERVNGEQMGYEDALEIARARQLRASQEQQSRQNEQAQRQSFDMQQSTQSAISNVERLEQQWRSTDPDYAALHPHIQAEMQTIARDFPPQMWPQQVQLLYTTLSRAMKQQNQQSRARSTTPSPLRGNGHAASQAVPKSAAEAALLAMGMSN